MSNICTRCGKERILSKKWKEVILLHGKETATIHTEYVCANPQCQRVVEDQLLKQKEKREFLESEKEKRNLARLKTSTSAVKALRA